MFDKYYITFFFTSWLKSEYIGSNNALNKQYRDLNKMPLALFSIVIDHSLKLWKTSLAAQIEMAGLLTLEIMFELADWVRSVR